MKKQYKNVISEKDFTELMAPKKMHHFDLPSEVIPDDENSNPVKETLAGMEYDIESREKLDDEEMPDEDLEYLLDEEGDSYEDDDDDDLLLIDEEDNATP